MRIVFTAAKGKKGQLRWNSFWRILAYKKGLYQHNPALIVEVSVKRLALTMGLMLVVTYLCLTAALAVYWGRRPHSPITYADVVWPGNWSSINPKKGQMLIAQGDEYFDKGQFREAFQLYRAGLRRYPQDQQARLRYAKILAKSNMIELAGDTLADGLKYGYPDKQEYLGVLFEIIRFQQNMDLVTTITPKLLEYDEVSAEPTQKYRLLKQLVQAQLVQGDYLGAIATAEKINRDPDAPFEANDVILTAYLKMGASDQAAEYLASLPEEERSKPQMRLLEAAILGEQSNTKAMMDVLRNLFREYPNAWRIQLSGIKLLLSYSEGPQPDAYIDLYVSTHQGNNNALNALAVFLTDVPDSKRLRRMLSVIERTRPAFAPTYEFFLIQALVTEGNFVEAKQRYKAWIATIPQNMPDREVIDVFGNILDATTDGGVGARNELLRKLRDEHFPSEIYWESALAMLHAGYPDLTIDIVNVAIDHYPTHPSLLELRERAMNHQNPGQGLSEPLTMGKTQKPQPSGLYDLTTEDSANSQEQPTEATP